jgi:hypothetical protein
MPVESGLLQKNRESDPRWQHRKRIESSGLSSKCWGRVDPDHDHFFFPRIVPTMASIAFEPKALVLMEDITFRFIEPDFEFAIQHINPVFPLVRIGTIAASGGWDSHQHRLEHFRPSGKKFHANSRLRLDGFPFVRADNAVRLFRNLVQFQDRRAVGAGQSRKGRDRRLGV